LNTKYCSLGRLNFQRVRSTLATSYTFGRASNPILFFVDTVLALADLYLFVFLDKLIDFERAFLIDFAEKSATANDGGEQVLVGCFLCCRLNSNSG
jgi:hypothetical protein